MVHVGGSSHLLVLWSNPCASLSEDQPTVLLITSEASSTPYPGAVPANTGPYTTTPRPFLGRVILELSYKDCRVMVPVGVPDRGAGTGLGVGPNCTWIHTLNPLRSRRVQDCNHHSGLVFGNTADWLRFLMAVGLRCPHPHYHPVGAGLLFLGPAVFVVTSRSLT